MSDYYEIMAEPLPNSRDFGFDCECDDPQLVEKCEAFKRTEGYWLWQIAMSEWFIRREQAELDRQADSEGAYAEYVRRTNQHVIAYEERNIAEYERKLDELRKEAAA